MTGIFWRHLLTNRYLNINRSRSKSRSKRFGKKTTKTLLPTYSWTLVYLETWLLPRFRNKQLYNIVFSFTIHRTHEYIISRYQDLVEKSSLDFFASHLTHSLTYELYLLSVSMAFSKLVLILVSFLYLSVVSKYFH